MGSMVLAFLKKVELMNCFYLLFAFAHLSNAINAEAQANLFLSLLSPFCLFETNLKAFD